MPPGIPRPDRFGRERSGYDPGMKHSHQPLLRLTFVIVVVGLLAAACADTGQDATPPAGNAMPSWIQSIQPSPDSSAMANTVIEVDHSQIDPEHFIRLLVDGVDVTSNATETEDMIVYRGLSKGSHTATVEETWLPEFGKQSDVISSYSWSFETL